MPIYPVRMMLSTSSKQSAPLSLQPDIFGHSGHHESTNLVRSKQALTRPWLASPKHITCRRIETNSITSAAWSVLCAQYLTPPEQLVYAQFPVNGPRSQEWLLGRIAAKEALQDLYGYEPLTVEVLATALGQPQFVSSHSILPKVSISHSHGTILVAVADQAVGIDLERLDVRRFGDWFHLAFTATELALIPKENRETALVAFWCAKEAVAKAVGTGLEGKPAQWSLVHASQDGKRVIVNHKNQNFEVQLWYEAREVVALCWC